MALLQLDGAGISVQTSAELIVAVRALLDNQAAAWSGMKNAMQRAARGGASARIVDDVETRFFV